MAKSRMKKNTAKVVSESIAFLMAEWFCEHKPEEILTHSLIADQIAQILRERGKFSKGDKVRAEMYKGIINDTRIYMIQMNKMTLKNIRQTSSVEGGYKIATDQEATHFGEQRIKRWGLAGRRAIEMIPLMKRQYLSRPIREIFHETLEGIKEIKGTAEQYLTAYDKGETERRQEEKEVRMIELKAKK